MSSYHPGASSYHTPPVKTRRATIACTKCRYRKVKCERVDNDPYSRAKCKRCTAKRLSCEYLAVSEEQDDLDEPSEMGVQLQPPSGHGYPSNAYSSYYGQNGQQGYPSMQGTAYYSGMPSQAHPGFSSPSPGPDHPMYRSRESYENRRESLRSPPPGPHHMSGFGTGSIPSGLPVPAPLPGQGYAQPGHAYEDLDRYGPPPIAQGGHSASSYQMAACHCNYAQGYICPLHGGGHGRR